MTSILYKDHLAVAIVSCDKDTGKWKVMIETSDKFYPCDKFTSQEAAESPGLKFATACINSRTETEGSAASVTI
jgi:hypothetical protein